MSTISARSKLSGNRKIENSQMKELLRDAAQEAANKDTDDMGGTRQAGVLTGVACDLLFEMEPLLRDL